MSGITEARRAASLARGLEVIAMVAMIATALAVVSVVVGRNGLDLVSGGPFDDRVMSVRADVDFPVDFGDRLAWTDGADGTVDAATGKAPVELSGPIRAQLAFWAPTTAERTAWVLWQASGPLLGFAGAWLIYGLTRSTRRGDPFTHANERRLWMLALVVAVGGTVYSWLGEGVRNWLIERSAAADLFTRSVTVSFVPIAFGVAIALIASVWRVGVSMREDVESLI